MLEKAARRAAAGAGVKLERVVLVDHGSPNPNVTRVRRALAARLRKLLEPALVWDASMERRPEPMYAFNDPLLENVFDLGGLSQVSGHVVVVPAFLFAGNHAGVGGDLDNILARVRAKHPELDVTFAGLLMDADNDAEVVALLEGRLKAALL